MTTPATVTTLNGATIPGVISGITVHTWTAESSGLYTTSTDLGAEWVAAYATMQAGNGNLLTPIQRLEANAQAVLLNTKEAKQTAAQQDVFREDAQREFDAIYAAMQIDKTLYGIDPNAQFNTYTYLKMEQTLQDNPELETLGLEGHGLNTPPAPAYGGYTNDIQNNVDGKTFYVGGGVDNGELAIANFFDDVVMSHAPFPVVWHNGVLEQLNQNGNFEDPLSAVVSSANAMTFTRVLVASDFSTDGSATGAVVAVPNPLAAPPLPTPAAPLAGVTTTDGSVIAETIAGLTVHVWTADATGLYGTQTDLAGEWKADEAAMLAGDGGNLTPLQRLEGNAEAVLDNTAASKMTAVQQASFRLDAQREFDAIDAAMRIDQITYGIDPTAPFTAASYLQMELTLQGNETLQELAIQGHGLNSPVATKYDGYTTDFQNRTDGATYYVGGGGDNGELAIAAYFDDVILTHATFPIVWHNGVQEQLNQNGNFEDTLATVVASANAGMFGQVLVAGDFSPDKTATGPVVAVSAATSPPAYAIAPLNAVQPAAASGMTAYTFTVTRSGDLATPTLLDYAVAGSGAAPVPGAAFVNPTGSVTFAAGASSATVTVEVVGAVVPVTEGFTVTLSGPAGTNIATPSASGTVTVGSSTQATVTGAAGAVVTLNFATQALAAQAQSQLSAISAAITTGSVVAASASGGTLPTLAAGVSGLAEIDTAANVTLPAGYATALDLAGGPTGIVAAAAGNQLVIASGGGALTYSAVAGVATVYAGTGNALVFGGGAALHFFAGSGAASLVGGSAGNTVAGGAGSLLFFASGSASYTGGGGAATVIGGAGPLNADLGAGGGVVFGSPGGGDVLRSGAGTSILVGGGQGDQAIATGAGNDVLAAGSGTETLNGAAATGNLVLFGGSGADSMVGGAGNDLFLPGTANATLTGGGGNNAYVFNATPGTTRIDTITDFNPATNAIGLFGYGSGPGADAAALASATVSAGKTTVSLSDGTTIVFLGAPTLNAYNFF